jgi:hypothetical protein
MAAMQYAFNQLTQAAIATPATPEKAPKIIDLSMLNHDFQSAWDNSFPGGESQETGGTLATNKSGIPSVLNKRAGTNGTFKANMSAPNGFKLFGTFHTHPYSKAEGGYTGIPHSGEDVANFINNSERRIVIVQSGRDQFLILRTSATSMSVDSAILASSYGKMATNNMRTMSPSLAFQAAVIFQARAHNFAFYKGTGGVFNRVYA